MARTKKSSIINVAIRTVTDAKTVADAMVSLADKVRKGEVTVYADVSGRLDAVADRVFTARPVGFSIPSAWDKLKGLMLDDKVLACTKGEFYSSDWNTVPEAIACLKEYDKTTTERMLVALKACDVDAFEDVADYISANVGASLNWEEVA